MSKNEDKGQAAANVMRETAERVCALLLEGMGNPDAWRKSWRSVTASLSGAVRCTDGYHLTGGNAWQLALIEMMGEHQGPWGTYNQWAEAGAQVRKGEKAAAYLLRPVNRKRKANDTERARNEAAGKANPDQVTWTTFGVYAVFGADQVDGWKGALDVAPPTTDAAHQWTADVIEAGRINVMAGEPACRPKAGLIYMPPAEAFESPETYLTTFWHEMTHWTAPKVNRDMTVKRWGDEGYAAEELVAEMGAAVIAARHGLSTEPRQDHLDYLAHWHRILSNDPSALWGAGKLAEQAASYLFDLVPLGETEPAPAMAVAA